MARKAKPLSPQLGLSLPSATSPIDLLPQDRTDAIVSTADLGQADLVDVEAFDDYDESIEIDGAPRLRLVDPPREAPTVIVEAVGNHFEVSRLRERGTTVATVTWTRKELEELIGRAQAALEMTR
jgi:hypothetical protein